MNDHAPDLCGGILAGGLASRMGPLGMTLNKSLLSAGQTPTIVQQILLMTRVGIKDVAVVLNPEWERQVCAVLGRAFAGRVNIHIVVERIPRGAGPALASLGQFAQRRGIIVFLADTWVSELSVGGQDWVGVSPATEDRVWCVRQDSGFADRFVRAGSSVANGVYSFGSGTHLERAALDAEQAEEKSLSNVLTRYLHSRNLQLHEFDAWEDLGTCEALAKAEASRFASRPMNRLKRISPGVVRKSGPADDIGSEAAYYRDLSIKARRIFPQMLGEGHGYYDIEYIEQSSLAHHYLYWPPSESFWSYAVKSVIETVKNDLWETPETPPHRAALWAQEIYVQKLVDRWSAWNHPIKEHSTLVVNGQRYMAGTRLIEHISSALGTLASTADGAVVHGDLNFNNILYSARSGSIKLLDPRGVRSTGKHGDSRYDIAKLRYSYHGWFCSIVSGLAEVSGRESHWKLETSVGGANDVVNAACDRYLSMYWDLNEISRIEASILLSAPPLHYDSVQQQLGLYLSGVLTAGVLVP